MEELGTSAVGRRLVQQVGAGMVVTLLVVTPKVVKLEDRLEATGAAQRVEAMEELTVVAVAAAVESGL